MPEHLAFPIRTAAGGWLATVDQDSEADVVQSVALLLDTRPGERRSVPDYGLPDPVFAGADAAHVAAAIDEWEPRADQTLVEQITSGAIDTLNVLPGTSGPGDYEIVTDAELEAEDDDTTDTTGA